jgi:hypothetical protein
MAAEDSIRIVGAWVKSMQQPEVRFVARLSQKRAGTEEEST